MATSFNAGSGFHPVANSIPQLPVNAWITGMAGSRNRHEDQRYGKSHLRQGAATLYFPLRDIFGDQSGKIACQHRQPLIHLLNSPMGRSMLVAFAGPASLSIALELRRSSRYLSIERRLSPAPPLSGQLISTACRLHSRPPPGDAGPGCRLHARPLCAVSCGQPPLARLSR